MLARNVCLEQNKRGLLGDSFLDFEHALKKRARRRSNAGSLQHLLELMVTAHMLLARIGCGRACEIDENKPAEAERREAIVWPATHATEEPLHKHPGGGMIPPTLVDVRKPHNEIAIVRMQMSCGEQSRHAFFRMAQPSGPKSRMYLLTNKHRLSGIFPRGRKPEIGVVSVASRHRKGAPLQIETATSVKHRDSASRRIDKPEINGGEDGGTHYAPKRAPDGAESR